MFVLNAWYVAAWSDELAERPLGRRICDIPIVLFRDPRSGAAAALLDRCCHRGAPLSSGTVQPAGLECGYHGLVYDVDGACIAIPGQKQIPKTACVRAFPLIEQDGLLWIWPGDKELADPALVTPYSYHGDAKSWPHRHDRYLVDANYMLLVDNLMDLSHLGYVHGSTIGGNPSIHMEAQMQTRTTPRGVFFARWLPDSAPPPTYLKAVPSLPPRVDRWQELEWIAPGAIIQWSGAVATGERAYEGGPRTGGVSLRLLHALTPETTRSTHYFWSVANGYRQDDPTATDDLFAEIGRAFAEDKAIIQSQQARLDELGEQGLIAIHTDRARIRMRRFVDDLIAQEQRARPSAAA